MDKKKFVRILLPVLIVRIVAGIRVLKNIVPAGNGISPESNTALVWHPDFALSAEAIDLESPKAAACSPRPVRRWF